MVPLPMVVRHELLDVYPTDCHGPRRSPESCASLASLVGGRCHGDVAASVEANSGNCVGARPCAPLDSQDSRSVLVGRMPYRGRHTCPTPHMLPHLPCEPDTSPSLAGRALAGDVSDCSRQESESMRMSQAL